MDLDELVYEWPVDILHYEPKIMGGVTFYELVGAAVGFLLPTLLMQSIAGLVLGVVIAAAVLLTIKKFDALGGRSFPLYVIARIRAARERRQVELPMIVSGGGGRVVVESWDGEPIMEVEE
ncbi:MAG TPA: hypothetical protein EYP52_06810 [Anaerolineae bacterium]|nr:hypothetical protein [Anaerolineae bacterium]